MIRTLSPKKHSICPPVILYVGPKLRNIGLVRSVLKNKSINIEYEKKIKKVWSNQHTTTRFDINDIKNKIMHI